jgi:hypothetical protein
MANQPGVFQATLLAKRTGIHDLRIALAAGNSDSGQVETSFGVELPAVETNQVWLNKPLLSDLATLSGGRYFDVDQIDQLADAVPDRTETIEVRSQPRALWDVQGMLVALVGLLCVEWTVRKRFRLL